MDANRINDWLETRLTELRATLAGDLLPNVRELQRVHEQAIKDLAARYETTLAAERTNAASILTAKDAEHATAIASLLTAHEAAIAKLTAEHAAALTNLRNDVAEALKLRDEARAKLTEERNARRVAERERDDVRKRFDPEIKAAEKASLSRKRDELLAEAERIRATIGIEYTQLQTVV